MNVDEKGQHIVDIRQCLVDSVFCGIFRLLLFYFVMANQMLFFVEQHLQFNFVSYSKVG